MYFSFHVEINHGDVVVDVNASAPRRVHTYVPIAENSTDHRNSYLGLGVWFLNMQMMILLRNHDSSGLLR